MHKILLPRLLFPEYTEPRKKRNNRIGSNIGAILVITSFINKEKECKVLRETIALSI